MPELVVEPLRPEQIRLIYPLLREVEPTVHLSAWTRFAGRATSRPASRRAGIIVARRAECRFLSGMVCYRRNRDLRFGYVLIAEHFVAIDILDPSPIAAAMADALDRIGAALRCGAIYSIVHHQQEEVISSLSAVGHRPEGVVLCKPFPRC